MSVFFGLNNADTRAELNLIIEDPSTEIHALVDAIHRSSPADKASALELAAGLQNKIAVDYLLRANAKITENALNTARGKDETIYNMMKAAAK